jgi:hypothetical protein
MVQLDRVSQPPPQTVLMNQIKGKQELLLSSLLQFYNQDGNKELILPIVKQQTTISLRLLDWLVTNYSKQNDIHYEMGGNRNFSIWLDYKNQLKAYSKKNFDPFCRRNRVFYNIVENTTTKIDKSMIEEYSDKEYGFVTTVGQLNFFRWALTHRVVDYAFDHLTEIESDMLMSADSRKCVEPCKGQRRRELSKVKKGIYKHEIKIVIQFP